MTSESYANQCLRPTHRNKRKWEQLCWNATLVLITS